MMTGRVLVTGGRGVLGREVVERLAAAGRMVRLMSRAPRPKGAILDTVEWAQADLTTGAGLAAAVAGADVVVHAATSPFRRTWAVDVEGTRRLVEAARAAGMRHLVYVSIVGIDRVPFPYYRAKLAAEGIVEFGGVPYSILRATQFHSLLAAPLEALGWLPLRVVPAGFKFQVVDPGEVAARLVELAGAEPSGRLPDFGGPRVRTAEELARAWAGVRGRRVLVVALPVPGAIAAAFKAGLNTCPDRAVGRVTWEEYLRSPRGSSAGVAG